MGQIFIMLDFYVQKHWKLAPMIMDSYNMNAIWKDGWQQMLANNVIHLSNGYKVLDLDHMTRVQISTQSQN